VLRLLILFGTRRARGRMALSIAGIALGVALGYGVHLVNLAAVSDVAAAVRSLAGEADLEVRGARSGFPEALYPRIARLPGVAWRARRSSCRPASPAASAPSRSPASTSCAPACCSPARGAGPRRAARAGPRFSFHGGRRHIGLAKGDTLR
jgi:hypothetical protein